MKDRANDILAVADAMPSDFSIRARLHYAKAVRKHPRFADALFSMYEHHTEYEDVRDEMIVDLAEAREDLMMDEQAKTVVAKSIVSVETLEAFVEYLRGDKAACVDELYDAVAVLMRMIAVVEGKQKLGGGR